MADVKSVPSVSVTYARTGTSTKVRRAIKAVVDIAAPIIPGGESKN